MTIVMIEDDSGHARLIEKNLRRAGVTSEILRFKDGTTALHEMLSDSAKLRGLVLVLLDLNLPDMAGTDILIRLKADVRMLCCPVVVLTTTDDKLEVQRCYDLGACAYVTKPVIYEDFAAAIRQLGLFLSIIQVPDVEPPSA